MPDQPGAPGTDPTPAPPAEPSKPTLADDPAYKAMQTKIQAFEQADADRAQSVKDAADAALVAEAEAKNDYDALKKINDDKLEAMKTQHEKEIQKRDLSLELAKNNVTDPFFSRVAATDYDGTDISAYVAELKNKHPQYFEKPGRTPMDPPATGPVSLSTTKPTMAQLDQITKTGTPEQVSEARNYMGKYFDTHGRFPD